MPSLETAEHRERLASRCGPAEAIRTRTRCCSVSFGSGTSCEGARELLPRDGGKVSCPNGVKVLTTIRSGTPSGGETRSGAQAGGLTARLVCLLYCPAVWLGIRPLRLIGHSHVRHRF